MYMLGDVGALRDILEALKGSLFREAHPRCRKDLVDQELDYGILYERGRRRRCEIAHVIIVDEIATMSVTVVCSRRGKADASATTAGLTWRFVTFSQPLEDLCAAPGRPGRLIESQRSAHTATRR
jgi:hypothetical protein